MLRRPLGRPLVGRNVLEDSIDVGAKSVDLFSIEDAGQHGVTALFELGAGGRDRFGPDAEVAGARDHLRILAQPAATSTSTAAGLLARVIVTNRCSIH
jgi:hypothetical protein